MTDDLATRWDCRMAETMPLSTPPEHVAIARRHFYAGALAAVEIALNGDRSTLGQLMAELRDYGRTVGTRLEVAR